MPTHGEFTPGFRFKDGKLMIFRGTEVLLLTGWPEPLALRKSDQGPNWETLVPGFRLVTPYRPAPPPKKGEAAGNATQLGFDFGGPHLEAPRRKPTQAQEKKRAFDSFRFSLPREVAKVLEPFRSHQWPLLVFLAHDQHALDLANSNPVLAYILAQRLNADVRTIQRQKLGTRSQRDLLEQLGLPATKAMVKIFRKIEPQSVHGESWPSLLEGLGAANGTVAKHLGHAPRINAGVLELILNPDLENCITPTLIEEVAADKRQRYHAETASMIANIMAMQEELSDHPGHFRQRFTSTERLQAAHEETMAIFAKLQEYKRHREFPPPPIPGIEGRIIPLTTAEMLMREGRTQHNCVASYADRVKAGKTFIYCVTLPERATLSIVRGPGGEWEIGELEVRYNTPVQRRTRRAVEAWLAGYRVGA